jgi:transposase
MRPQKGFLKQEEKEELRFAHRQSKSKKEADRIKSILYLDKGMNYAEIASLLFTDEGTPPLWYSKYEKGGIDKLC